METLCTVAAVALVGTYLGEGTLLGQCALVGLSEQLFEGVPHCGVGPLLSWKLLEPRKAAHVKSFVVIRQIKLSFTQARAVGGCHIAKTNQQPAIIIMYINLKEQ